MIEEFSVNTLEAACIGVSIHNIDQSIYKISGIYAF